MKDYFRSLKVYVIVRVFDLESSRVGIRVYFEPDEQMLSEEARKEDNGRTSYLMRPKFLV